MPSPAYEALLALAQRRVATDEGVKLYGKPIGSIIGEEGGRPPVGGGPRAQTPDGEAVAQNSRIGEQKSKQQEAVAPKKVITVERLKSLQRQLKNAMKTDNTALYKSISREFNEAFSEFAKDRSPEEVLALLGKKK